MKAIIAACMLAAGTQLVLGGNSASGELREFVRKDLTREIEQARSEAAAGEREASSALAAAPRSRRAGKEHSQYQPLTRPAPVPSAFGDCPSWNTPAGSYMCGQRIQWKKSAKGGNLNAKDARNFVAQERHAECGSCSSDGPRPNPRDDPGRSKMRGVNICTPTLLDSKSQNTPSDWVFHGSSGRNTKGAHSCKSQEGGVNDVLASANRTFSDSQGSYVYNHPVPCFDGKRGMPIPNSVYIETTPGEAECLVAKAPQCKIPIRDFLSLDYDLGVSKCMGMWAAPLWLTPDTWVGGGRSGEIDSTEFCPRNSLALNFAAGGHQIKLPQATFDLNGDSAHITVRKDKFGIITITFCKWGSGQCR